MRFAEFRCSRSVIRKSTNDGNGTDARTGSDLQDGLGQRYVRCSYHKPKNAIVDRVAGVALEGPLAERISKHLPQSHGICPRCNNEINERIDSLPLFDSITQGQK